MKKHGLLLFFISVMMFITATSFCEDMYRKDLYRLNWYEVGTVMSDASRDFLDEVYTRIIDTYKCDLPVCIRKASDKEIHEQGKTFYEHNKYGYGSDKVGILLMYYADTKQCAVMGFGSQYSKHDFSKVGMSFVRELDTKHDWYNALYNYLVEVLTELEKISRLGDAADAAQNEITSLAAQNMSARQMPDWYPKDVSQFKDFHDYNAPRVVDNADIFTADEEARMLEGIRRIQNDYNIDLVIFTDTDSYGLSHAVYSADFHHFNGYGFGDDYTGSVLFICMNPNHRGWWTSATGSIEYLYKDMSTINWLDDMLEPYMRGGKYGEGVISYIDNVHSLYWEPDWVPKDKANFVRKHEPAAPRLIDEIGLFSAEQAANIEEQLDSLRTEVGSDVMILTTDKQIRGNVKTYIDSLYQYKGYGFGENFDGVVMCIYAPTDNWRDCYVRGYGRCSEKGWRLEKFLSGSVEKGEYDKAVKKYLRLAKWLCQKNYVPKKIDWKPTLFWMAVVGLIAGFIHANGLKRKMKTIAKATTAGSYIVDGSFKIDGQHDKFVNSKVTRVYDPPSSSSSGGSRGGSYHSSGGRSYSGGGRSF